MAKLDKKQVLHIASLANLKLTESEVKKFTPELSKIVDFVSELSEVDVKGVEPTSQTTGLMNINRNDIASSEDSLTGEEVFGTDKVHNNYFVVDALLSERSDK